MYWVHWIFHICLQSFSKAYDMWNHLHKLYHQTNKARKFYLDTVPAKYCQGSKTVQKNFSGFLALSNEMNSMMLKDVPSAFLIHVKKIKKESHVSQFQMDLRPEFEPSMLVSSRWTSICCTILLIYVDDTIINGNDDVSIWDLKGSNVVLKLDLWRLPSDTHSVARWMEDKIQN